MYLRVEALSAGMEARRDRSAHRPFGSTLVVDPAETGAIKVSAIAWGFAPDLGVEVLSVEFGLDSIARRNRRRGAVPIGHGARSIGPDSGNDRLPT
jgi:hypothetical protein